MRLFSHRMLDETRLGHKTLIGTVIDLSSLKDLIRKKSWKELVPIIDLVVSEIKNSRLSALLINQLILVTIPNREIIRDDAFLNEVLYPLNEHFKDIKAYYDIHQRQKALRIAKRCKEIIELAQGIQSAADEEGLAPLKVSELVEVDEFKGRKVYRVKPN